MTSQQPDIDVLIVGAGPVGLTAAVEAKRLGLSYRIVERKDRRRSDTRAIVVHPRVIELIAPNGNIVEKLDREGFRNQGMNMYYKKTGKVHRALASEMVWGDTDYPYLQFIPQNETIQCLEEVLKEQGGPFVEFGVSLEDLDQSDDNMVTSTLRRRHNNNIKGDDAENDELEKVTSKYVVGCDGGRSRTRDLIGIALHRKRHEWITLMCDIQFTSNPPLVQKQAHFWPSDGSGTTGILPLPGEHCYRFLRNPVPRDITLDTDVNTLDDAYFEKLFREGSGLLEEKFEMKVIDWKSVFEITHGLADSYRKGRVFLAGDSAHVHSPVGGQGMNYGMQDVHNLLWKLKWQERAEKQAAAAATADEPATPPPNQVILDSYGQERHAFGAELIQGVSLATRLTTTTNPAVIWLRDFVMSAVFENRKKHMFRIMGELDQTFRPEWSPILFSSNNNGTSKNSMFSGSSASYGNSMFSGVSLGLFGCKDNTAFICKPGERLPNLKLSSSANDSSRLHHLVDRERHTWVFLNCDDTEMAVSTPPKGNTTNLKMVRATPAPEEEQKSFPVVPQANLQAAQVVLVRPDLWVAGVAETFEELWNQVVQVLDAPSASVM